MNVPLVLFQLTVCCFERQGYFLFLKASSLKPFTLLEDKEFMKYLTVAKKLVM